MAFQEMMLKTQLQDAGFQGQQFTWSNGRKVGLVKERIDRAMVSSSWRLLYPDSQVYHYPQIGSDHCPIILTTEAQSVSRRRKFRFDHMWTREPACKEVIKQSWDINAGNDNYALQKNLNGCSRALTKWRKAYYPNNRMAIEELTAKLGKLQDKADTSGAGNESLIVKQIEEHWTREEMYWQQRSRVDWLRLGDRNTAFFHNVTIQRRASNKILRIQNEKGVWIDKEDNISDTFKQYYEKLFSSDGPIGIDMVLDHIKPVVQNDLKENLQKNVTAEEIKIAALQMAPLKAPGPDGFSGIFFQKYWDDVGESVTKAVQAFFNQGYKMLLLSTSKHNRKWVIHVLFYIGIFNQTGGANLRVASSNLM